MSEIVEIPCILIEVETSTAVRAWESLYYFDTTDGGRLEPLPHFVFELYEVSRLEPYIQERNTGRRYRLYENDHPSQGGQWHHEIDTARRRATHVIESYAWRRAAEIYNVKRQLAFTLYHKLKDITPPRNNN